MTDRYLQAAADQDRVRAAINLLGDRATPDDSFVAHSFLRRIGRSQVRALAFDGTRRDPLRECVRMAGSL